MSHKRRTRLNEAEICDTTEVYTRTTAGWLSFHMYVVVSSAFKSAQSFGGDVIQSMCMYELAEDRAVRM